MRDFARDLVRFWKGEPAYFWPSVAVGYLVFKVLADWAVMHQVPTFASITWEAGRTLLAFALGSAWGVQSRRRKLGRVG